MIKRLSKCALMASVATCMLAPATAAFAAEGDDEEIIVQARKRDESIMNVPVVAAVLGTEKLDQYGISDVRNIADKVPGLSYQTGNNASGTMVSLRGVGTSSNNPALDPSVALVVDGQPFSQGLAFQSATFDMARVEVLKGPQALFFGKGAPGGVVSIRTADPGDELQGSLRAGYEIEAKKKLVEAVIGGPVTETLGLRLAAQYTKSDGYFHNTANPAAGAAGWGALPPVSDRLINQKTLNLRATAVWNPISSLSARLKFNYTKDDMQGFGGTGQIGYCPEGTIGRLGLPYNPIAGDDCKLNRDWSNPTLNPAVYGRGTIQNNGVPFNENEQVFGSLELNYDLNDRVTLTSLTSLYHVTQKSLGETSVASSAGVTFALDGRWRKRDFTQEVRLNTRFDSPLNFMLGGFYQNGRIKYAFDLPVNTLFAAFRLPPSLGQFSSVIDLKTYSLFGQASYKLMPELELAAGARWTKETRDIVPTLVTGPGYSPAGTVIPVKVNRLAPKNWSPEITLTYTPTPDFTVFGSLKQAYKPGSFDVGGTITPNTDISFGDEKVQSAELGIKARMLDGSLFVNVAGYFEKFQGMQVKAATVATLTSIAVRTVNAGEAEIYGLDMDFRYAPKSIDGLTISGGVNWNHARYTKFPNAQCWFNQLASEGCNQMLDPTSNRFTAQNLKGQELVRAPDWTGTIGFDYEGQLSDAMKFRLGSNVSYSSSYSTSITNFRQARQQAYAKLGVTLGLTGPDDRWAFEVIGDNLTDKLTSGGCEVNAFADGLAFGSRAGLTGGAVRGPTGLPETLCFVNPGRSVNLRFTFKY